MHPLAILVVSVVAAGVAWMIWSRHRHERRHAAFAAAQGWSFAPGNPHGREDGEQYYTVGGKTGSRSWRMWYGLTEDPAWYCIFWEAMDAPCDDAQRFRLWCASAPRHIPIPLSHVPPQELEEIRAVDHQARVLLEREEAMRPVSLEDPDLADRFQLKAGNPEFALRLLTPRVRALLADPAIAPESFSMYMGREESWTGCLTIRYVVLRGDLRPALLRLARLGEAMLELG